jgi:hypothetical protein
MHVLKQSGFIIDVYEDKLYTTINNKKMLIHPLKVVFEFEVRTEFKSEKESKSNSGNN